ncbi:hypothetical protein CTA2_620 [Colletotrichum tanaceti]|uniref:Heterokaryon incompatibility domain-containing protein n=1 Tax=Colletotrichum tanaceti TaxID=1306861 RepID=A0A4V6DHJ7_9PEZI|nr:hypothetical protein CTA2_620 [Colletotrichum tanaceti]TKW50346.1 hypothetical protein CTA1_569 [Colletotrichum tanaceti]
MASVYGCAFVTVIAANAGDCSDGFFRRSMDDDDDDDDDDDSVADNRRHVMSVFRSGGEIISFQDEPINARAWTLQELVGGCPAGVGTTCVRKRDRRPTHRPRPKSMVSRAAEGLEIGPVPSEGGPSALTRRGQESATVDLDMESDVDNLRQPATELHFLAHNPLSQRVVWLGLGTHGRGWIPESWVFSCQGTAPNGFRKAKRLSMISFR